MIIQNIAALQAIATPLTNETYDVLGYYAPGDNGGGAFYWDSASSETPNAGTILSGVSSTGRWKRIYTTFIDLRWFGVKDGIDCSSQLTTALSLSDVVILEDKTFTTTNTVIIPSYKQLCGKGAVISSTADPILSIQPYAERIELSGLSITGSGNNTAIEITGIHSGQYASTAKACDLTFVRVTKCGLSLKLTNARKVNLLSCEFYSKSGIYYYDCTAEVNIDNCFIVSDSSSTSDFGLKVEANTASAPQTPEGLSVSNTMFYQFPVNLWITDLFIGTFSSCYFDATGKDQNIRMEYKIKNDGTLFNNCWFFSQGINYTPQAPASPKLFRSSVNNCYFQAQSGISVSIQPMAHEIAVSNCRFNGSTTGTQVGLVCANNNNNISLSDCNFAYYESIAQFKGAGQYNTVSGIVCNGLTTPYYFEYPVNIFNSEGMPRSFQNTIPQGYSFPVAGSISSLTGIFNGGVYKITLNGAITVSHAGYLLLNLPAGAKVLDGVYRHLDLSSNPVEISWLVQMAEYGVSGTISVLSETLGNGAAGNFSTSFFNYFSIVKMS
ncbi:hypothetical protein [Chitinophaga arvensicola]|uniref:Right handed beta helix region n=1 Tax=Chitinophaga arvensicola TaxID=29529 RepID=A0A1I0SA06_9BACT|nr:hypothetical protein [Chitinophaga arvensicola]SEW52886.1 hypothetical protein SAMN04488122_5211 [Chitinophaga arvensicola]